MPAYSFIYRRPQQAERNNINYWDPAKCMVGVKETISALAVAEMYSRGIVKLVN